ncbi:hypothetical protein HAX54_007568 [Datura stramonium]|uniref:Uncharacterized protein n=1 Tax=Datura stramonium TaxID=4076 RepID=A0ABS8TDG3_DATST|nr:hypothetical protein [Datura stramonium]
MADKSIKTSVGEVEDVLVKVRKFVIQTDFVLLDCDVNRDIPIILGFGDICVANVVRNEHEGAKHKFEASPNKKKAKSKWVKEYLWLKTQKRGEEVPSQAQLTMCMIYGIFHHSGTLNQALHGRKAKGCYTIWSVHIMPRC